MAFPNRSFEKKPPSVVGAGVGVGVVAREEGAVAADVEVGAGATVGIGECSEGISV